MIRLDNKEELIKSCCGILSVVQRYQGVMSKGLKNQICRSVSKDLKKGLRAIDRKCPVYIEMPNLKEMGNGMYKENFSDIDSIQDEEIIVTSPVVVKPNNITEKKNE